MNQKHYSEADLLETYYTRPGESMPVMMHLADCTDCAARYERLEAKLRGTASCPHDEQPETFWTRQRHSIMRRVAKADRPLPMWRIAAAVLLAFVLGSFVTRETIRKTPVPAPVQQPQAVSAPAPVASEAVPLETLASDPWESDELNEFESMVAWESWVEDRS